MPALELWQIAVLAGECTAIALIELIAASRRWARAHPDEHARLAAAHERQDRLEGRL